MSVFAMSPRCAHLTCVLAIVTVVVIHPHSTPPVKAVPTGLVQNDELFWPPLFFDNAPESYKTKLSKVDSSIPLIRCYCNLPECLDATHGMPVCHTRQGCFSRIKTNATELSGPSKLLDPYPAPTTPRPIPKVFDERLLMSKTDHEVNGAHGCLDLLPTTLTCNEMRKTTDKEFPAFPSSDSSETIYAYHCCEYNMCNKPLMSSIAIPILRLVRESLRKVFQSSMASKKASVTDNRTNGLTTEIPDLAEMWVNPFNTINGKKSVRAKPGKFVVVADNSGGGKSYVEPELSSPTTDDQEIEDILWKNVYDETDCDNVQETTSVDDEQAPEVFPTSDVQKPIYYVTNKVLVDDLSKAVQFKMDKYVRFFEALLRGRMYEESKGLNDEPTGTEQTKIDDDSDA